jgi:hypothetical protein
METAYLVAAALGAVSTSIGAIWALIRDRYFKKEDRPVRLQIRAGDQEVEINAAKMNAEELKLIIAALEQVQRREKKEQSAPRPAAEGPTV